MKQQSTRTQYRNYKTAFDLCEEVKLLAKEYDLSFSDALKAYELAIRDNALSAYIENGDFLDENLFGIGEALEQLVVVNSKRK